MDSDSVPLPGPSRQRRRSIALGAALLLAFALERVFALSAHPSVPPGALAPKVPPWAVVLPGMLLGLVGAAWFHLLDIAAFSLDREELQQLARARPEAARRLHGLRRDIGRTWLTLLAGSLFFNLCLGLSTAGALLRLFGSWGWPQAVAALAGAVAVTLGFGEILPGIVASRRRKELAPLAARSIRFWSRLMAPLVLPLLGLLRRLGNLMPGGSEDSLRSLEVEKRLLALIGAGRVQVTLEEEQRELIDSALEFGQRRASDVMRPRGELVTIPTTASREEVQQILCESRYSRYLVHRGNLDEIEGILHTKEFMLRREVDYHEILRPPVYVEEDTDLIELLDLMRRRRTQILVVLDVHGSTVGLVSMNDILKALVGRLPDEDEDTADTGAGEATP